MITATTYGHAIVAAGIAAMLAMTLSGCGSSPSIDTGSIAQSATSPSASVDEVQEAALQAAADAEAKRVAAEAQAAADAAAAQVAAEAAAAQAAAEAQAAADAAAAQAAADAAAQAAAAQPISAYYENCDAARAAGAAPVYDGDPGYSRKLDRDGDGVGCE